MAKLAEKRELTPNELDNLVASVLEGRIDRFLKNIDLNKILTEPKLMGLECSLPELANSIQRLLDSKRLNLELSHVSFGIQQSGWHQLQITFDANLRIKPPE